MYGNLDDITVSLNRFPSVSIPIIIWIGNPRITQVYGLYTLNIFAHNVAIKRYFDIS